MYRHRFLGLLILPSLFSMIVGVLLSVGIIVGVNWSLLVDNLPFYDYFFGFDGTVTNLQKSATGVVTIDETLHNKSFAILLAVLAIAGGIAIAVRSIAGVISGIAWTMQQMHAVDGTTKHALERELGKRAITRSLVALVWAGYAFVWVKAVLPFVILPVSWRSIEKVRSAKA